MSVFPFDGLAGEAYGPGSSRRHRAALIIAADSARLVDETGATLAEGRARREARIAGGPSRVVLPGEWVFECRDHGALDAALGPARGDWLIRAEAWHPRLIAVVAGCLLGVWLIWRHGLDLLVAAAIALTPPTLVEAIDRGNLAAVDRMFAEETGLPPDRQAGIRAIFDAIAAAAPPPPYGEYRLVLRDVPGLGPNAFALPGGTLVLTDDLAERFPDDDVIAAVLGHEIAHVSERHSLRQLYRSLSIYMLVALIAGDVGPVLEDVLLEGNLLLSLAYSRAHERDADALGIEIAARAGYDPAALITFFEALDRIAAPQGPAWRSTHPLSADRARAVEEMLSERD
ncbi:M48 family metallopeptidase [Rhodovulum euryhalinum]|uniref:Peptidase M48-like protein n=1 Tax=Rhodovulum euryhalinum TaxID=35805 RepID=A0A4R2KGN1_9RHOB|nr:M48 family metallopeptidase [Rhodovulum euryhalinum]TCO72911.1 peptidase M48-like protein [Rhodovulum euryhalinum]